MTGHMDRSRIPLRTLLGLGSLILAGCQSPGGVAAPQEQATSLVVGSEPFVAGDAQTRAAVSCPALEDHLQGDGRLEVIAVLANRSDHAVSLEVECVFGDDQGAPVEDPGSWQKVTIAAGASEAVRFQSVATTARRYTLRARHAR